MKELTLVNKAYLKLFGRSTLILKKHSPVILTRVGIAGVVAGAVLACRATLKLEPLLNDFDKNREAVSMAYGDNEEQARKIRAVLYTKFAVDIVKCYGPSVAIGVAGIGAIMGGHTILQRRNVAMVGAYKALETTFKEYRARVANQLGVDKERELLLPIKEETIEDEKTGKEKVSRYVDKNAGHSMYARVFDESCREWSKQPEYNLVFLNAQQNYANDLLRVRGHVTLNDVYDLLGFERTNFGQVVGWVRGHGDNQVDFGIYDYTSYAPRKDFINGLEACVLLDFNVDGNILDLI